MSRNWIAPKCKYEIKDKFVTTDKSHIEKISGTSLGAFIGCSEYGTPFTASTKLLGLWGEDISNKPSVITGTVLEERIIEYQASKHPTLGNFLKATDVFDARTGDHSDWGSDFEDDVFSGHVDGIISKDGKDYILEVKTANIKQIEEKGTWRNGVPEHYLWQVYLYNHFITQQDTAYFLLGIVDETTYKNPYLWVPNKDNCKIFPVSIDREMVARKIEEVRQIYNNTVAKGISMPCTTSPLDAEIMTYLSDIGGDMDNLKNLILEYKTLKAKEKALKDKYKDDNDRMNELNDRIKSIMSARNFTECDGVKYSESHRKSFNFNKADADKLDITKYISESIVKTITIKKE